MDKIKVGLVEDKSYLQKVIIEKLSYISAIQLVLTAKNGKQCCEELARHANIDLLFMDIQMPVMDGIEATSIIKTKHPHIKIIMLTVFDDDENIFKAIKAGADGYLLKDTDIEGLSKAVTDSMKGGASMTPSIALKTLELLRSDKSFQSTEQQSFSLTKREKEVLLQLSKGLTYKDISENLFISPATVRKHIENTYKKLQVHNKIEAISKAKQNKIIP